MYIVLGVKKADYGWQKLSPLLDAYKKDESEVEEYYGQILSSLEQNEAVVEVINLQVANAKNKLKGLAAEKKDSNKLVFLGASFLAAPKLLNLLSSEFGKAAFLLLYEKPEQAIARMLGQKSTCEQSFNQWMFAAKNFLNLHRHHRQNSHVLDVGSVLQSSDSFFKICKEHYGLSGNFDAFVSSCSGITIEKPDTLNILIAQQLLQKSEEAGLLVSEISASTMPLAKNETGEDLSLDLDTLLHLNRGKQRIAEENELLLIQLHHVQEELEAYYLKNQNLKQEKSKLEGLIGQSKKKISSAQVELIKTNRELQRNGLVKSELALIKQTLAYRLARPLIAWQKSIAISRLRRRNLHLIEKSDYFDAAWYLENYSDVKQANISPALHYLLYGGFEERDPSPRFSSFAYLHRYPDIAGSGVNPLVHYLLYGEKEGRDTN